MEVLVRSTENVKPSFSSKSKASNEGDEVEDELSRRPPFKLCIMDQLTPPLYTPLVLFYPATTEGRGNWSPETMSHKLKESLSQALTSFYPLSGRVKDNAVVDDFEAGVPFIETRVQGHRRLSEFLDPPRLDFLNKLYPVEPCCRHTQQLLPPQVIVQMNTFDCGGVAIGLCFYHQTMDGATISTFLKTWAAHSRQPIIIPSTSNEVVHHVSANDLTGGYSAFPPPPSGIPPDQLASLTDKLWFSPYRDDTATTTTRRFVISNHAIATLKSRAAVGTSMENPSRTEAILAFIWKSMLAAAVASKSPKPLCLVQGVNLRPRMKKKKNGTNHDLVFSQHSIGNLFTSVVSFCDDDDDISSYNYLAGLIRGGVERALDEKYLSVLSSEQGLETIVEWMKELQGTHVPMLGCSSWLGFGFSETDFGWGTPVWSGVVGEASGNSPVIVNIVILKELAAKNEKNNGVEAWMRIDPILMASLEKDPRFLEFASPNPHILF